MKPAGSALASDDNQQYGHGERFGPRSVLLVVQTSSSARIVRPETIASSREARVAVSELVVLHLHI
jgi:hypothetical protein